MRSKAELLEMLRNLQRACEEQGCEHVALDVILGKPIIYVEFTDLIAKLEKTDPELN